MDKITLLKERKNGGEGLWVKLTDNPNSGKEIAETTGSIMVSRK